MQVTFFFFHFMNIFMNFVVKYLLCYIAVSFFRHSSHVYVESPLPVFRSIHCTNGAENGESCQALTTLHRHTSTMAGMDSMPFSETVRFLDNCRFVKVSRYLRIPNGLLWENSSRLSANLRTDIFSDGTVNRVGTPIAILF